MENKQKNQYYMVYIILGAWLCGIGFGRQISVGASYLSNALLFGGILITFIGVMYWIRVQNAAKNQNKNT